MAVIRSLALFVLAGLCEIGGGYLVWLWLRGHRSPMLGLAGAVVLVAYGVVATLQSASFGRVYAAYGGIFTTMAVLWGWLVDRSVPDRFEVVGAVIALIGVLVIMYAPRS